MYWIIRSYITSSDCSSSVVDLFDEMYMRPKDDYRKDTLIKKEIYQNKVVGKYNLLCVYDDRLSVCRAWNDLGIFVFTVNQGLHEF